VTTAKHYALAFDAAEDGKHASLDWIEQCFYVPANTGETVFTGQKTQPTVSKY